MIHAPDSLNHVLLIVLPDYAREVAICLATGGEILKHNLESASGSALAC